MQPELPTLIISLLEPSRYPKGVDKVELVQTHISWVLLAGEFAYKIKKPMSMPFLDFSSLAKRHECCQDELRLNRRFAPDLYLEVLGISGTAADPHWGGPGKPIEYAVKMRRFDNEKRLDRVCARGDLTPSLVSDLAREIIAFHDATAVAQPHSVMGTAQLAMAAVADNLAVIGNLLESPVVQRRLTTLVGWVQDNGREILPLMHQRHQSGHVRECHGDLHLGNLVLIDGHVRLFDCIEFNANLRWIDVLSELAFPYMDLLQHQQPGLANWLVNEVLSQTGDYAAAELLRFYAVHRAMVRSTVAAIRVSQTSVDATAAQSELLSYLALAEHLAKPTAQRLTITHGLSGCGKTVASSRWLLNDTEGNTIRLRSDVERKRMFGLSALQRSGSNLDDGIYAPEAHQRTYARLLDTSRCLLNSGWSVVVDAAFLRHSERHAFAELARNVGASFAILAPSVPVAQLRERILERQLSAHDASEATLAVLDKQLNWIEELTAEEQSFRLMLA